MNYEALLEKIKKKQEYFAIIGFDNLAAEYKEIITAFEELLKNKI